MNIFVLDRDPVRAAQAVCDKHCVRMVLETAQLLCSAFPAGGAPYKRTHYNHPCAIWTRASRSNALWLAEHGLALADEYAYRYGKQHASEAVIMWTVRNLSSAGLPDDGPTPFAQAMPDEYKRPDAVDAYRAYYQGAKARLAAWNKARPAPTWWAPVAA